MQDFFLAAEIIITRWGSEHTSDHIISFIKKHIYLHKLYYKILQHSQIWYIFFFDSQASVFFCSLLEQNISLRVTSATCFSHQKQQQEKKLSSVARSCVWNSTLFCFFLFLLQAEELCIFLLHGKFRAACTMMHTVSPLHPGIKHGRPSGIAHNPSISFLISTPLEWLE